MIQEERIGYYEWLAEIKAMDRNLDVKEKIKVWSKFSWNKPLNLPKKAKNTLMLHFGGSKDGLPLTFR